MLSPIRRAELKLAESLPELIDVALRLALEGDGKMVMYCVDRVLGRIVQPISIETQIHEIANDFGVEPERVTSIVERLRSQRAG